jgi:hypothetical protein
MEVENIVDDRLICCQCLLQKKQLISNYDSKDSIIDMDLRPIHKFKIDDFQWAFNDHEFRFSPDPLIVNTDTSYTEEAYEEDESNIDPEEMIQSSWHHRALLGDENREIYDDGQDTDFEAFEAYWKLIHEMEETYDDDYNCNSHLYEP